MLTVCLFYQLEAEYVGPMSDTDAVNQLTLMPYLLPAMHQAMWNDELALRQSTFMHERLHISIRRSFRGRG